MSAWIVSKEHIDLMVAGIVEGKGRLDDCKIIAAAYAQLGWTDVSRFRSRSAPIANAGVSAEKKGGD